MVCEQLDRDIKPLPVAVTDLMRSAGLYAHIVWANRLAKPLSQEKVTMLIKGKEWERMIDNHAIEHTRPPHHR